MAARDRVVEWAKWWAAPGQYKPHPTELVSFFVDSAAEGAPTLADAEKDLVVRSTGVRVQGQVKHWCGIFACSVLRTCGIDARWTLMNGTIKGTGATGIPHGYPTRPGSNQMRPGDVAIIQRGVHHFIITSIDYANNTLECVEGNTSGQLIRESVKKIRYTGADADRTVVGFYRLTA